MSAPFNPEHYFPAPGCETLFSDPGAFQNMLGTCLNASGLIVVSNLHVKMFETIVKSIESKHFWIFQHFLEGV